MHLRPVILKLNPDKCLTATSPLPDSDFIGGKSTNWWTYPEQGTKEVGSC